MKKSIMLLVAVIMIAGFTNKVIAQHHETTDVGAKIVIALTISEKSPLHFGTMTIPISATEVKLSTIAGRSATALADITFLPQVPTATNAAYDIVGSANETYAITLPANGVVTIAAGAIIIPVKDFIAKCTSKELEGTTGTLSGLGADHFVIGATLSLANAQAAGVYAGTFDVSVDYN